MWRATFTPFIIGNAKIAGMADDAHLTGLKYNIVRDYFVIYGGLDLTDKRLQQSSLYEYMSIREFDYLKLHLIDTICSRGSTFVRA